MNAIILSAEQFSAIQDQLVKLEKSIHVNLNNVGKVIYENDEFIEKMKISKRTSQSWRDKGLISFTQVGSKIYFTQDDVDAFLLKYKNYSFVK